MRVKLLAKHFINDREWPVDTIMNVAVVTPLMEGLDSEAQVAIEQEKLRVYGRWVGRWPHLHLLDDPPIIRSLDNAQPVPPVGSSGGPPR